MADESLDYERTLQVLLGVIGEPVRVELSGVEPGFRAAAGFSGILERGSEDVVVRVVGDDEAINFSVVSDAGDQIGWFIVGQPTFQTAVIVRSGPLADTLVIRAGSMNVQVATVSGNI